MTPPPRDPWAGATPGQCRATLAELAGWNADAVALARKEPNPAAETKAPKRKVARAR